MANNNGTKIKTSQVLWKRANFDLESSNFLKTDKWITMQILLKIISETPFDLGTVRKRRS